MKVRFATILTIFTTLLWVLVACSEVGDSPPATVETAATQPAATVGASRNESGDNDMRASPMEPATASVTASLPDDEVCTDKNTGASMSYREALAIAVSSQCVAEGQLLKSHFCNENSGTWWTDLAVDKAGCSPACVVNVNTETAEINWRCTGAMPPASDEEASGNTPKLEAGPAPAVFDYSDWNTYTNQEHGYEVKYPPGVTPYWDDEAKAVTFEGPLEDDEHWPAIFVGHGTTDFYQPPDGTPVREWVQSTSGQPENSFSEDTEIAGREAYHWTFNRSPQSYASDQYFFIKDGQMFSIVLLHTGDKKDWTMYEQFLQSFTFLEPGEQAAMATVVEGWTGVISANPLGTQSRFVFERPDGRRWIVGTSDETLWATIAEAAWKGVEVQLAGFEAPMPSLINVSRITLLGEAPVEARDLSYFARPSASSALPADRLGTYHEWSAIDGRPESPWCEGADGPGDDEWLQLDFESPIEATMIQIVNGYDYNDDIYHKNNRLKRATFVFSDGERIEWEFDDTRSWQSVPLGRAPGPNIMTTSVKIIIDEVYPGTAFDDTCIGEVAIWGRPQ